MWSKTTILLLLAITALTKANESSWSEWSPCSRSCDGGITQRFRPCSKAAEEFSCSSPEGTQSQHKICNMHSCPQDDEQRPCDQHNDQLHQGEYYEWEPFVHDNDTCALWCRAKEDPSVQIKGQKLVDGSKCSLDSLSVCLDGQCQAVGCDLIVGSAQKVDSCGVCGGSDECSENGIFVWGEVALSHCSVPCGGGYMMARSVCQNNQTKATVQDDFCNLSHKPTSRMAPCNTHPCPARWEVEDWQPCSHSCGGGLRSRSVKCIIDKDGAKVTVGDENCPDLKPPSRETCNIDNCPQWFTGIWSECNEKCGQGLQHRNVICRDGQGFISTACDFAVKPAAKQPCTGLICTNSELEEKNERQKKTVEEAEESNKVTTGWMKLDSGILKVPPKKKSIENTSSTSSSVINATEKSTQENSIVPSEASFIVEEWGPCSSPCGEGIRERKVECKIFLEFSKTIATLPDHECPGPKPAMTEICFSGLCQAGVDFSNISPPVTSALRINNVQKDQVIPHRMEPENGENVYSWKDVGFTACSESCLGGLQESKIICVNEKDDAVSPMHCNMAERPEVIVRTCNDHPCPPRWNVSDFSGCSKSCGGGIQTRNVSCIQEVRHGGNNILRVDDSFCPQPPPITQQFCSVVDCPAEWKSGPWSKCSKKCGGGHKLRDVVCQQSLALGELANKPDRECPLSKPERKKSCNSQPCLFSEDPNFNDVEDRKPIIKANVNQVYEQTSLNQHTVRLKIGGQATVFKGTKLKIRCPVKKFDRGEIQWAKGDQLIGKGGKRARKRSSAGGLNAFVTRKGSLRIPGIGYQDAGIYSCMAEGSTAKINILVKPRDSNDVFPDENTNEISGWKDYEKNLIKDYAYGLTTPSYDSHLFSGNLHMRFNEVEEGQTTPKNDWKSNLIEGENNHLRFNEVGEDWNEITWGPFGDNALDYPANQAKAKDLLATNLLNDQDIGIGTSSGCQGACRISFSSLLLILCAIIITKASNSLWNKRHLASPLLQNYEKEDDENDIEEPKLQLKWTTSDWSSCSQSCGENGTQIRTVECAVIKKDAEEIIPYQICIDAGLEPPAAIQSCGISKCPQWTSQNWVPCKEAKCIAKRTGFQTRDVICSIGDKAVDDKYCEAVLRPRSSQTCHNRRCKGIWKTGPWSQCNVSCGVGHKQRSVECVWKLSGHPAGDACRTRSIPNAIEQCQVPPCTTTTPVTPTNNDIQSDSSCHGDSSKYCGLIVSFKMCHKDKYQKLCCASCT